MSTEQRVIQAAADFRGRPVDELVGWQIDSSFFQRWTFWRVESDAMPAFPVCVAALADNARVIVFDNGFASLTAIEPIEIASVDQAVDYIRFFVQVAKPDTDVLESLEDIPGVPKQKAQAYQGVVTPPRSEWTVEGHRVQAYLLDEAALVRAEFDIDERGRITARTEVVEPEISIFTAIE